MLRNSPLRMNSHRSLTVHIDRHQESQEWSLPCWANLWIEQYTGFLPTVPYTSKQFVRLEHTLALGIDTQALSLGTSSKHVNHGQYIVKILCVHCVCSIQFLRGQSVLNASQFTST